MSRNVHIVFSKPPDRISDEEFNRWYDPHLDEILVVPGFVSARRFRMERARRGPGCGRRAVGATSPCTRSRTTCRRSWPTSTTRHPA